MCKTSFTYVKEGFQTREGSKKNTEWLVKPVFQEQQKLFVLT